MVPVTVFYLLFNSWRLKDILRDCHALTSTCAVQYSGFELIAVRFNWNLFVNENWSCSQSWDLWKQCNLSHCFQSRLLTLQIGVPKLLYDTFRAYSVNTWDEMWYGSPSPLPFNFWSLFVNTSQIKWLVDLRDGYIRDIYKIDILSFMRLLTCIWSALPKDTIEHC